MLILKVTHEFDKLAASLSRQAKQVAYASAVALTRTGQDVKKAQQLEIDRVIDRPTRYTKNAVFLRRADRNNLSAEVWLKHGNKNTHYLEPLIEGGGRPLKRFEDRMVKTGFIQSGERLVPSRIPPRDQFGNVGRGYYTKILSQLKTAVIHGDYSNANDSARSKAKRSAQEFFWSAGPGTEIVQVRESKDAKGRTIRKLYRGRQHLRRGVWMVQRTAFGNAVRPVLYAVNGVAYRKIYDFYGVASRTFNANFAQHFDRELSKALATAR
jgi:hypothetical protein